MLRPEASQLWNCLDRLASSDAQLHFIRDKSVQGKHFIDFHFVVLSLSLSPPSHSKHFYISFG